MDINEVRSLIKEDMKAVDQLIHRKLSSDVALINQLSGHIINSGGKRLRPMLVLLAAHACNYQGSAHVNIATIIEFIHTATLLHDDVVDNSELRRGNSTANAIWGNAASVLVGDFLYSRSFQMMVEIDSMRIMQILADTTNTIAEGEVMQLLCCHDPDATEVRYKEIIRCKTAKLFEAAAQLGAVLAKRSEQEESALARYGLQLGMAFQLIDDALDYSAVKEDIGKNIGDDLAEGKPTLPLIHALRQSSPEEAQIIREAIAQGGKHNMNAIIEIIESTGAIPYTRSLAKREAKQAMDAIAPVSPSSYKDALMGLVEFSVNRNY